MGSPTGLSAFLLTLAFAAQEGPPTLVPLLTLPTDASILGEISDVDALPGGEILVLDSQAKQILVYDGAGTLVRTLGREGEGPGEIRGAFEIEVTPEGGVWALDNGNARVTRWGPDGEVEATHLFQDLFGDLSGWPDELVLTDSGPYLKIFPFMPGGSIRVLRLEDDLTGVADTVAVVKEGPGATTCKFCPMTFGPSGRILAAQGDTFYAVSELGLGGEAVTLFSRHDLPAVERSKEELEGLYDSARRLPVLEGVSAPSPEFSAFKHRFGGLSIGVDDGGRVWLLPRVGDGEDSVFDLFSASGDFLASIPAHAPLSGFRIKGDRIYAIMESPLGEPMVRVYGIR